ncbi:hypothetical protein ACFFP0_06025 [Rhizobium puerariae]|uniref:Uncharacterized protein n=1 Tax=Rhizobium puerariae TaxID=1585791 RepID=A0ABV6AGC3_9HYPH
MALAFDLRRPAGTSPLGKVLPYLRSGTDICLIASSFVFLFAVIFGVF